jgi:hypothetical protein
MIIDAHAHLGYDCVFDWEINEKELVDCCNSNDIDVAIVQPMINRPYIEDTIKIHDRIHRFCKTYSGRFWGMASINPHFKLDDYEKEAIRCIKDLGFVALKINPQGHAVHPSSKDGINVFECARKLHVPVMVHTGEGSPFSDPVSILPAVEKFDGVKIILAHCGKDLFFQQALYIAKKFKNIYMEPSWTNVLYIQDIIREIGPARVMFSTDDPVNAPVELAKYRTAIKDKSALEQVFSGTAKEVFNLRI